MSSPRSPLARMLPVMRRGEPPEDWQRIDRVHAGRFARDEHDAILLWRKDLNPMQLAAADTIAGQVLGGQKR